MKKTKFILFLVFLLSVALLIIMPGCRQKKAEAKKTKDVKVRIPEFYFQGEDANDYFDESAEEFDESSGEFSGYDPEESPESMRRLWIHSSDNEQPQELQQESAYGELSEQTDDANAEPESDYYDEYEEDAEEEYEGEAEQYDEDDEEGYEEDDEEYEEEPEQYDEDDEEGEEYEEEYPDEDSGTEPSEY